MAWGGQGLSHLVPSTLGVSAVGLGLGLVGSAMQTGAGLIRVQRGLRASDASMVKLGLLDVGGGLLWLGWDLLGARQPLFIASYMLAKIGREAYANREALHRARVSLGRRVRDTLLGRPRSDRDGR
jgi:hypothetical protein